MNYKFILGILFIFSTLNARAQSFNVFNLDTTAFPRMKASFYAFDAGGKQIHTFSNSDFKIFENGASRDVVSVTCPPIPEPVVLSLAISIDISGSMCSGEGGTPSVELGKTTASNLVQALNMPPHEVAIQTCDSRASINLDFTTDKQKILKTISVIQAGGDNDFVEHLLNPRAGILNVAKEGKKKRIALLCTDAWWNKLSDQDLKRCIDTCKKYGITFYAVIYNRAETEPDGIKASLKAIAEASGGKLYDGVINPEDAKNLANELSSTIQLDKPCHLEWIGDFDCKRGSIKVDFTYTPLALNVSNSYELPFSGLSVIKLVPNAVKFSNPPINKKKDTTIAITNRSKDVEITDIILSHPDYSVSPKQFTLKKDETKYITLSYTSADSVYSYCKMEIVTNYCGVMGYAAAIYGGKAIPTNSLKVTFPNGGESFAVGADTVVTWEGSLPDDEIALDFSHDNGATWTNLTTKAKDFRYKWKGIPNKPSDICLIRAKKLSEIKNATLKSHTEEVTSVSFNPDGLSLASGDGDGYVKIWDVATGSLIKTLSGHSESVYNVAYSSDSKKLFTGGWDNDIIMWNPSTGEKIKTFNSSPTYYTAFAINANATAMACGMIDNSIRIIDVSNSATLKTLTGHASYVNSLSFNQDNSLLASGGADNSVKIWDAKTGALLKTLSAHKYPVMSLSFAGDATTLASGGSDKFVHVWDAKSGKLLKSIDCGFEINSVAFSPDGDKVACAGANDNIRVYNIISGELVNTYTGHTDDVLSVAYNMDGTALVSGSSDQSVRLWGQGVSVQSDVSDAVWSIVKPEISASDIDCGNVLIGKHKDTAIAKYFINQSKLGCAISNINITGPQADEFKMISTKAPFEVAAMSSRAIEIHFKPKTVGPKMAEIEITTAHGVKKYNLRGEGVAIELALESAVIDFGKLKLGLRKDTLVATIKNLSSTSAEIKSIEFLGPDKDQFKIIDGGETFILPPGDMHMMTLEFAPVSPGRTSGSVGFHYDGFASPAVLQLFGEGIGQNAPKISSNSPLCKGDELHLFADSIYQATYYWRGPNNFTSSDRNPVIKNVKAEHTGRYFVNATVNGSSSDTVFIDVQVMTELVAPGDSSFIFVGSARKTNEIIQLTNSSRWDGGSIWLKNRFSVKKDFETTFRFRYSNGNNYATDDGYIPGADGIAFVMQNHNYPFLGEAGGAMGYKGITNSLAIEVDLWMNGYDPNGNHIAVQSLKSGGNQPDHSLAGANLAMNSDIITLKPDVAYYIKIKYDWNEKNLKVYLDTNESYSEEVINIEDIDLASYLALEEGEYVYIGFTSGTGDSYEEHYIENWTIPCLNQFISAEDPPAISWDESLNYYPNPANDRLTVLLKDGSLRTSRIDIYDLLGNLVISTKPDNSSEVQSIDISALPRGSYLLRVGSRSGIFIKN